MSNPRETESSADDVRTARRLFPATEHLAYFDRTITVHTDHRLVTTGPYAWVRHPSYTGALAVFARFGLAQANWLSLGAAVALPGAVYVRRIAIEERALRAAFGAEYESYAAPRKRLVPGVY